jgi:glycerophosphoryl diester phosphodiesterase
VAFDHGLALGADGLEFDVHLSRDGVVVVHHDATLERTTNGRGRISDFTADDLAQVDAAHWFTPIGSRTEYPFRGQGHGIPRLQTVLARYAGIPIIIELKDSDPRLVERTIDALREANAIDRAALGSFYWRALNHAREDEPRLRTGSSREETRWALYRSRLRWPVRRAAFQEFQVPEAVGGTTVVTPRFIAHAHRAGLPVKVWTVDDRHDIRRLIEWGVDGLISDRPDIAVDVVRRMTDLRET